MRALVWKELRELRWAAVALVGCAMVIAAGNALYDRLYMLNNMPEFGLKTWEIISLVVALLAGSATFAREGRERAVFLSSWPQSRTGVWLVKVLVNFVVTAAVLVIGTLICLAAPRLAFVGYDIRHDFQMEFGWLIAYALLLFLFGLMWSGLIRSVLGAAEELRGRLELPAERKVGQLSRGMPGKAALLLALAPRPKLLILDDPTMGVDVVVRREFME
ncbi:MAG TPA: hypothetical protein VHP11_05275, partial [Tepidisphaeraceae bacterium]|nr:hypothetical protein [Tepidisphaeraceae bacterium]